MAKLKLEDEVLDRLLDILDAHERNTSARAADHERFSYRNRVRIEIETGRDTHVTWTVPCRSISQSELRLLVGTVVNQATRCRIDLITVHNSWQTVTGVVEDCRYIQGAQGIHEIAVRFDLLLDPASFSRNAVRTRVLLADDSPTARRLLAQWLKPLNVEVMEVDDGAAAVHAALGEPFDVILMDVEMPGVGGLHAVSMLRSKGYVRPVVAVTALSDPTDRERCFQAGFDDYLAKPPSREELARVVQHARPEPLVSTLLHEAEMAPLIDAFVHDLPEHVARLESALATANMHDLAVETRLLKGEAGGYGFEPITVCATALERGLRTGAAPEEVRRLLSQLVRVCLAARPATLGGVARRAGAAEVVDAGATA